MTQRRGQVAYVLPTTHESNRGDTDIAEGRRMVDSGIHVSQRTVRRYTADTSSPGGLALSKSAMAVFRHANISAERREL